MRIEKIRLKNLNSLVGEWEIDLTAPQYVSDGIFAITGPTGSGKTTILDAICLALYGRTPRLEKVSKTENEIMARRTAECAAEVVFKTAGGRYLCQWKQSRAKSRPDGALQPPIHTFSAFPELQLIENKTSLVTKKVEDVTGLDYSRFTRSMLLAQGDFAAFLEAESKDRSPLLEKITGTEIYSRISKETQKRQSENKKKVELLEAALSGFKAISEDDEKALKERTAFLSKELAVLETNLTLNSKALIWREKICSLQTELGAISNHISELFQRIEEFQPQQERLQMALKAIELSGPYSALKNQREERDSEKRTLDKAGDALPSLTHLALQARQSMERSEVDVQAAKKDIETITPTITKTRELDLKIEQTNSSLKQLQDQYDKRRKSLAALLESIRQNQAAMKEKQEQSEQLQASLLESQQDEDLVTLLPTLYERQSGLAKLEKSLSEKNKEVAAAVEVAKKASAHIDLMGKSLKTLQDSLELDKTQRMNKEAELKNILGDRRVADLRSEKEVAIALLRNTEKTLTDIEAIELMETELAATKLLCRNLVEEGINLNNSLTQAQAASETLENRMTALEEQLADKRTIEDLQTLRATLADGKPCPLCGSENHPFRDSAPKVPNVTEKSLKEVKAEHKASLKAAEGIKLKLARLEKDIERERGECLRLSTAIPDSINKLKTLLESLPLEREIIGGKAACEKAGGEKAASEKTYGEQTIGEQTTREQTIGEQAAGEQTTSEQTIDEQTDAYENYDATTYADKLFAAPNALKSLHQAVGALTQRAAGKQQQLDMEILAVEKIDKSIEVIRDRVECLTDELAEINQRYQNHQHTKESQEMLAAKYADDAENISLNLSGAKQDIVQQIAQYGAGSDMLEGLKQLAKRNSARQTAKKNLSLLQTALASVASTIETQNERCGLENAELEKSHADVSDQKARLAQLSAERTALFGSLNPNSEEKRLQGALKQAENELEVRRSAHNSASIALDRARTTQQSLTESLKARELSISALETAFADMLADNDFSGEEHYLKACLTDAERKKISQQSADLNNEKTQLTTLQKEKTKTLASEEELALSPLAAEELKQSVDQLSAQKDAMLEESGKINGELAANERIKSERKQVLTDIKLARQQLDRWERLYKLIGSADGNKYRNYVQGLTFDILLNLANMQLTKMSDRYRLVRNEQKQLSAAVIDGYQASEVRPTKTLSGGESFIVSLALALGLSMMAGENVRVDSLFLDEGFGTLDEDALDTALDTLGSLRQEGKMIGLISHVSALTERIGARIEVTPVSGGKSALAGPGCRAILD